MEKQKSVSPSRQCSSTPVGIGQGLLNKEQCDNSGAASDLIFTSSLRWNHHWRDGAVVILLTSLRMRRKSLKGFHQMAYRNYSNTCTVPGRSVWVHTGRARSEPGGTRWRKGGEVKGKLANGVGSQYSQATSERGISIITKADAYNSAASRRLNWRPHRFKWTRPFRGKTNSGFSVCAITFRTSYT